MISIKNTKKKMRRIRKTKQVNFSREAKKLLRSETLDQYHAAKTEIFGLLAKMSANKIRQAIIDLSFDNAVMSSAVMKEFISDSVSMKDLGIRAVLPYLSALNGLKPELWFWQDEEERSIFLNGDKKLKTDFLPLSTKSKGPLCLEEEYKTSGVSPKRKKLIWSSIKRIALFANYKESKAMTVLAVMLKLAARDRQYDVLMWGMGHLVALNNDCKEDTTDHTTDKINYCVKCVRRKSRYITDKEIRHSVLSICDSLS